MKIITEYPTYTVSESLGINQSNWDHPEHLGLGQLHMEQLFKTVALEPGKAQALNRSAQTLDIDGLQLNDPLMPERKISGEQFLNRRLYNDALLVMQGTEVLHESYRNGMTADDRHVIHSCSKSLCSIVVAITIEQGLLQSSELISHYIPEFRQRPEWQGVTLQHVLDMQAGIAYSEDYSDPDAHYWHYARAAGYYPPLAGEHAIGAKAWIIDNLNTRSHAPGSSFVYNSCLANILGMALEAVHRKPLAAIFEQLLYQVAGTESAAYFNTDPMGFAIVEGQLNMRLQDFARCASIMLNQGKNLSNQQIIAPAFISETIPPDLHAKAIYQAVDSDTVFKLGQYKNQFWILSPEQKQFAMLGIHGQFAWYDLRRELMIVGFGSYPRQDGPLMTQSLNTLWQAIAAQV
ncbi:serine hydrolase [Dasania marina]|uniref:serine hydrolase domain-containing protein n=1 Tax=Dasania marina TaxID=471499 RepID=UPI0030D845C8|tara:strand:- start:21837 stop:23051 length:1215 start_codon:yes stop_codon:yes gene_type:complete